MGVAVDIAREREGERERETDRQREREEVREDGEGEERGGRDREYPDDQRYIAVNQALGTVINHNYGCVIQS